MSSGEENQPPVNGNAAGSTASEESVVFEGHAVHMSSDSSDSSGTMLNLGMPNGLDPGDGEPTPVESESTSSATSTETNSSNDSSSERRSSTTSTLSDGSSSSSAGESAAPCVAAPSSPSQSGDCIGVIGSSQRKRPHGGDDGPSRKKPKTAQSAQTLCLLRDKLFRRRVSPAKEFRLKLSRHTPDRLKKYYGEGNLVQTWFEMGRLRRAIAKGWHPRVAEAIQRFLAKRMKRLANSRSRSVSCGGPSKRTAATGSETPSVDQDKHQFDDFMDAMHKLRMAKTSYQRCKRRLMKQRKDRDPEIVEPTQDQYQRLLDTKVANVRQIKDYGVKVSVEQYEGGGCRVLWPYDQYPTFDSEVLDSSRLAVHDHMQKWVAKLADAEKRSENAKDEREIKRAKKKTEKVESEKGEAWAGALHAAAMVLLKKKIRAWGLKTPILFRRRIDRSYDTAVPGANVFGFLRSIPQPLCGAYSEAYNIFQPRLHSLSEVKKIHVVKESVLKFQKDVLVNLGKFFRYKDHPEKREADRQLQNERNARRKETKEKKSDKIRLSNYRLNSKKIKSL